MWFVAAELGLPDLFEGVTKWGPSDLDHPWHEMIDLRPATVEDSNENGSYGTVQKLVDAFRSAKATQVE